MEFKTKYNIGQLVYIIENNIIIRIPVGRIKIVSEHHTEIEYSFVTSKATTSLDKDKIVLRKEDAVFETPDEIVSPFKTLNAIENFIS